MGVVWVHWLMARGQILKESLCPLRPPYCYLHIHVGARFNGCLRVTRAVIVPGKS